MFIVSFNAFPSKKAGKTYFYEMMRGGVLITPKKDRLKNFYSKVKKLILNYGSFNLQPFCK